MPRVGAYRGEALPYYGRLIVSDPSVSGSEEADLVRCVADSEEAVIGGSRWRVAVKAAQDTLPIVVHLELWDTPPDTEADGDWTGRRELTVEFPDGQLACENISAGPVPLSPGDVERVTLPDGAGAYRIAAWHRGRDQAAAAAEELWEAEEEADEQAAPEEYLLRVWPVSRGRSAAAPG